MVCQAMIIAITVVLPVPVASFRASRGQARIGRLASTLEVLKEGRPCLACRRRDLSEPDDSLDSLDLAEEGALTRELVMTPMLEEPGRFGSHAPISLIGELSPLVDLPA